MLRSSTASPHLDTLRARGGSVIAPVCALDVNETLLDMAALDPIFERTFGDASARRAWFAQMLQLALVSTITGEYHDFGALGMAALGMIGERTGVAIGDQERTAVRDGMRSLPAHPEVPGALRRLRDGGARLAALTNSTEEVGAAQLRSSGLDDLVGEVISADAVHRLKPAPEPYLAAATRLGVEPGGLWLVAAHSWDVAGAMAAGCRAAFIARPGMVLDPLAPRPEIVVRDLDEATTALLAAS